MGFGKIFKAFAGTAVGIIAGLTLGPGAFNATAYAIGSLLGGFLFNRPQKPRGRELDNLNIGGSSYGEFIPIIYGGVPTGETTGGFVLAGNVIDAKSENAITEARYSDKTNWHLTFAVLFGDCSDGTPRIIDKVWGYTPSNSYVLYERGSSSGFQLTLDPATGMESGYWPGEQGTNPIFGGGNPYRQKLYLSRGTGSQTVPPEFDALHDGTGCPYRWQSVVWFVNLFIGNTNGEGWGGQPPTIRALVRDDRTGIAEIIEGHLVRGRIPSGKIDMSNVPSDKEVAGCAQLAKEGARELVDHLAAIAFCDIVRVGDTVVASDRTNPTIHTVAASDLAAHAPGGEFPDLWRYTDEAKTRTPTKFNLSFIDPALDYKKNTTTAVRGVGESYSEESVDMAVVMPFAQATRLCKIMLDEAIAFSTPYKVALPSKYIKVAPGDVLEIPINNETVQVRVTDQSMGAPGPMTCDGSSYDSGIYDNIEEIAPEPRPPSTPLSYESDVLIWDMNTARDADVDRGPGGVLYAAVSRPSGATFRAVTITPQFSSVPVVGFRSYTFNMPAVVGASVDSLAFFAGGSNQWDYDNTVQVAVDDELTSADDENQILLGGINLACLKCGTNWEIFHFVNAVFDGTSGGKNLYTLSTLLRGQRGTEGMMSGHAIGNTFVLLDEAVKTMPVYLTPAVGFTAQFLRQDTLELETGTVYQHSIKPFSPVQITGERDESNNLHLSWTKRSKYSDRSDSTGIAPRNAPNDRDWFFIDVMSGTTVIAQRTASNTEVVDGATRFYLDFSAAEQSGAGITPGDPVTVNIYQGSNIVSRGYAGTATI